MATVNVWRCAYVGDDYDEAKIRFTGWVQEDGIDEVLAELAAVNPPMNGSPGGTPPTVIGWQKMKLDTEPI